MGDVGMHIVFEKDICKMVWGAMVLMRGVQIWTMYKLVEKVDTNGCVNTIIPKVNGISSCLLDSIILCH